MLKRLALGLAVLASAHPAFAQFDLTARVSKDQTILLEAAGGKPVALVPTEIKKTKEVVLPFNMKRTGYFDLPSAITQIQPTRIHFGPRNPEKGWGLRLARLAPKEGKVEVTMKLGAMSMSPAKEALPYDEDTKLPVATKSPDGQFVLDLPKALAPGIYAVIGFNGAAGPGGFFSTKDGIAWVFEVPATQPVVAAAPTATPAPAPVQPEAAPALSVPAAAPVTPTPPAGQ